MVLSEYEEQRLRNISANQEILASLGLDEATRKRERPEQSRQPRAPQPRQQKCALHNPTAYGSAVTVLTLTLTLTRTRVSFRHHGLEPDADAEEVDQAMQVARPARHRHHHLCAAPSSPPPPPLLHLLHHFLHHTMQVAAAGPSLVPHDPRGPPRVPRPAVPTLTAAQRGSLAAAQANPSPSPNPNP